MHGIAVTIVAMAVLGMHTLGMGHGHSMTLDPSGSTSAGQHQSAHTSVTTAVRPTPAYATQHAASVTTRAGLADVLSADVLSARVEHVDATVGVMCLAILPLLAWLLLLWRRTVMTRCRPRELLQAGLRTSVRSRSAPTYLAPSLTRLCVART